MRVEVPLQQLEDVDQDRVPDRVEDLVADFPADHHVAATQHGEVLRQVGLLDLQQLLQPAGRQLGAAYFVTGRITSVDEKLSDIRRLQYSLFLQVLEVETGLVRWQHEVTRSKQLKR